MYCRLYHIKEMNKKTFITILLVLVGITAGAQELAWRECRESLPGDHHIMPVRCHDNNHQENAKASVQSTIDGDRETNWHSAYYPEHKKVTPESPAELVYEFEDIVRIDRMVYVPRQDGSPNGIVVEAEVLVKTSTDADFRPVGRYTWENNMEPKTVRFEGGIHSPAAVMFRVLRGVGELGSCAEMQFLCDGEGLKECPLFADELYTVLKPGVTDEDIERTEIPVYRELARELKNGSYQTVYRVATFECYDHPQWLAKEWRTPNKFYDLLQGVTGIVMEPGKHLVMVSGLPDGQTADLKVVAWYVGRTGRNFDGGKPEILTYPLLNGANVIDHGSSWPGLAYIAYFSEGHAADLPPIRVHFVGSTVNGYLTPDMTDGQMHRMTAAAPSRFIDVVSRKVHAVWTAAGMHDFCKADDGRSPGYRQYMGILDSLLTWQQQLVGMEKYGRTPRNRSLLYVNFTYGCLYQDRLGISAHIDLERSLLNCRSLRFKDSETIWGLAHEWGHQHQLQPYFCWGGISEVTNNLNAYYSLMRMGYRYEDLDEGKRKGLEHAVAQYIDGETDDCIFYMDESHEDAFERLCPFLKLCQYFTTEAGMPDFLPDLYETLRHSDVTPDSTNIVPYVFNFIRKVSVLSGYNLTPYFERFGFLRVKSFKLGDYGLHTYRLTQEQLDRFRREMNGMTKRKKLKPMPDGMMERIAHLVAPDK